MYIFLNYKSLAGNNRYPSQKPTPRFQLCTYKKCEWIATNKCEKCSSK